MRLINILLVFILALSLSLMACSANVVTLKPSITKQTAKKYHSLRTFIKGHLSSELSGRHRYYMQDNKDEMEGHGIYLYFAEISSAGLTDSVSLLLWPREQLKLFCIAQGGKFSDFYRKGASILRMEQRFSKLRLSHGRTALIHAVKKNAFGQKLCTVADNELWRARISSTRRAGTRMGGFDIFLAVRDISGRAR